MPVIDARVERWLKHWSDDKPQWVSEDEIVMLISASEYAGEQLQRFPALYDFLQKQRQWATYDFFAQWEAGESPEDDAAFLAKLRRFKHRHQIALILDVIAERINQLDFLKAISDLAQCLVSQTHDWYFTKLCARYGSPHDSAGDAMGMVILAMGKFGGHELNFSSDIDLIFAYREAGETQANDEQKSIDHELFFRKLAQKIIQALDNVTTDGFVYRVDMRLRPFGQSGPLALSFEAMEQYYLVHGRNWERYAMMKARPVAGDIKGGEQLLNTLQPFIYRRYLDFEALSAISEMKQGINRQIREEGMQRHVKLGAGGIREAEFCVQAMQMVYGGRYPQLQNPNFIDALTDLSTLELWDEQQSTQLQQAYILLRTVENAIQFDREQQTHQLPQTAQEWSRLALATGYDTTQALKEALERARQHVDDIFHEIFTSEDITIDDGLSGINWASPDLSVIAHWLASHEVGGAIRDEMVKRIAHFSERMHWRRLPQLTVERLERLLPQIIMESVKAQHANGLSGLLDLIEAVSGRSVYIDMLAEQPNLLSHLFDIASSSKWLMQFICEHPLVLDEVLSERSAFKDRDMLAKDLAARLQGIDDDEDWLHSLRDFKHAQVFKVAWADMHGTFGLMTVSDCLSHIAELVLENVYQRAFNKTQERYGQPRDKDGNPVQFAIIGYGKLGGLELGYGSDLDLLFLYDEVAGSGMTDGKRAIDNSVFFTRLVQRLNHYLSAPSTSGKLYEIDTRLRPGGRSGMVVSRMMAFKKYQHENAWTWEHQALTRARFVCGDAQLGQAFEAFRREILTLKRDDTLRQQVISMREKMFRNHRLSDDGLFHVKQSRGGLIDIEFLVQYLLLKHASHEPFIARMSDNVRQLAALEAAGILRSPVAMALRDAYRNLRGVAHRRYLNGQDSCVAAQEWQALREKVVAIWNDTFSDTVILTTDETDHS